MRREKIEELNKIIEGLKVLKKEEINTDKKFISSKVFNCYLNNGEVIKREQLLKGGLEGSAALILPVLENGEVILTVEPRVFTKRTVGVGIPAGYIEQGEDPIEGAKRELLEETGYTSDEIISLGGFYQDMGVSAAYNRIFLALNASKTGETNFDPGEYVEIFKCTLDEALELIDLNYIEGCNAIITLNRAKKYLKGRGN